MADITDAYTLFHDGILALQKVEQAGLRIDLDYIKTKKEDLTHQIHQLEEDFITTKFYTDWKQTVNGSTINIYSPTQLGQYLYGNRGYKINRQTTSGAGSTDEETLQQLGIPELNILLEIKKLKKIRDTYLDGFEREAIDGYIHPFYNLGLVKSYRSSSDSPNFQNIPKRDQEAMDACRRAIYPRPGHQLIELDYKQLEVRISACYNKDERLIKDIIKGDMHRDMSIEIFMIDKFDPKDPTHAILRQAAKNGFVFPQFYGDYYKNCAPYLAYNWGQLPKSTKWKKGEGIKFENTYLSDHLISKRIKNLDDFTDHIKKIEYSFWKKRYYKYDEWKENIWQEYQRNGYIWSKTGFKYSGVMKRNDVTNYPIQGSAFHCLLWSLIHGVKAQTSEHWKTKIVGQIHDSIIIDAHPKEVDHVIKVMKCIMCNDIIKKWDWITVPLDVDVELCPVDGSWAEKHK